MKIKQLFNLCRSAYKHRYISYWAMLFRFFKNSHLIYKQVISDDLCKYKTSDTIFILGSGPSLGNLTEKEWQHIAQHDSFGINFSYLTGFAPTYYSLEDGKTRWLRNFVEQRLSKRKEMLSKTLWCISERHLTRGIHPRLTPEFFPVNPLFYRYKYPETIDINADRPFCEKDFKRTIMYRGSLSVVLSLIDKMNYKKIVLIGVDMLTKEHFFDNMEEMQEYNEFYKKLHADKEKYDYMSVKENKQRPMDEYLIALNELYLKKRGAKLMVNSKSNFMYPKLEAYSWSELA